MTRCVAQSLNRPDPESPHSQLGTRRRKGRVWSRNSGGQAAVTTEGILGPFDPSSTGQHCTLSLI